MPRPATEAARRRRERDSSPILHAAQRAPTPTYAPHALRERPKARFDKPKKSAEHVSDRVAPGLLTRQKARCRECAVREKIAIRGAVRELQTLAVAQQVHGVISDHVATTHAEHAQLVDRARAHFTIATVKLTHARAH